MEFPRTRLKYIRELGKGWFGRVVEGTAQGFDSTDKDAWKPVVVRILEASASSRQRILFLHDASIYRCTPHPNILLLLGRSLDTVPLLLLQEYTNQVRNYLIFGLRINFGCLKNRIMILYLMSLSTIIIYITETIYNGYV